MFVHDAFSQRDFLGPDARSKVEQIRRPSARDAPQRFLPCQELGSGASSVGRTVTTNFICPIDFARPARAFRPVFLTRDSSRRLLPREAAAAGAGAERLLQEGFLQASVCPV